MTTHRWTLLVAAFLVSGAAGCATAESSEEQPSDEQAVREAPSESDEPPVWAEGPVGSDRPPESVDEEDAEVADEASEKGDERARQGEDRSRRRERRRRRSPRGLAGVFPDEQVTLDFRRARISRIMRIFTVKAKVNIVLADEVEGKMSVSMEETPIEEAFRAILQAAGLTFERRKGAVFVEPAE